jgi:hypothetical protein
MTGDQANYYQSAASIFWLFMSLGRNLPGSAEQKSRSYLTICEWLKKLREDGPLPRLSKCSQQIIGKEAS